MICLHERRHERLFSLSPAPFLSSFSASSSSSTASFSALLSSRLTAPIPLKSKNRKTKELALGRLRIEESQVPFGTYIVYLKKKKREWDPIEIQTHSTLSMNRARPCLLGTNTFRFFVQNAQYSYHPVVVFIRSPAGLVMFVINVRIDTGGKNLIPWDKLLLLRCTTPFFEVFRLLWVISRCQRPWASSVQSKVIEPAGRGGDTRAPSGRSVNLPRVASSCLWRAAAPRVWLRPQCTLAQAAAPSRELAVDSGTKSIDHNETKEQSAVIILC